MANARSGMPGGGAWAVGMAAIAILFSLVSSLGAQFPQTDDSARPPRVRVLMKTALDDYKRGDYETAAKLFVQVQENQGELSPTERNDLNNFVQKNQTALSVQRDGGLQVRAAEEAMQQGRTRDAARLARILIANEYLTAADRQALATLTQKLRMDANPNGPAKSAEIVAKNDEKSLLSAGREALKRGDLDAAEALAAQAEKVAGWVHPPWIDSPSKLRRDIAAARKANAPPPKVIVSDKKESSGIFKLFSKTKDEKKDTIAPASDGMAHGPDLPPPPLLVKSDPANKPGPGNESTMQQTAYPAPPPGSALANKTLARKLIKDGYRALEANDFEGARRLALQAKELHPDLEWWEENPGRLLEDIQRRSAARQGVVAAKTPMPPGAPAGDAHNLIKEARFLLVQDKIDEADKLCTKASAAQSKGWGLFEDSPDKLRADIQKARTRRDRDEAAKLMLEARKLYNLGNLQEAKQKAYVAQKLHGPYSIWDMGDRPQKLLEEIHRAEIKTHPFGPPPGEVAKTLEPRKGPDPIDLQVSAQNKGAPGLPTPPLPSVNPGSVMVSGTAQAATKIRAIALVQEARELQKQGHLLDARAKAIEADQLRVNFGPEEDNPASVLVSLAAQCERMVDVYLKRATDKVQNHPTDPARFQKADADINTARLYARAFKLDTARIEQKAQWLQQAAASAGLQPIAATANPNDPTAVVHAGGVAPPPMLPAPPPLPAAMNPQANQQRLLGMEKLDKARLELKAGNLALARRLAEEAFHPQYGVQEEAANVLRSIDADEYNHRVNMANRNADAGMDAYNRADFRQAAGIFNSLDMTLLQADKSRRIGEIMSMPQMQPGAPPTPGLQAVDLKQPVQGSNPASRPGTAVASDIMPNDDLGSFRAMEEIQFQRMRDHGLTAQKTAMELFKSGHKDEAIDVLKHYLDELTPLNFDGQRLALLKRPVENRLQQYRTVLTQEAVEEQVNSFSTHHDDGKRERAIHKTQEEVAEQIKQYRLLVKEGKYKEALAAARKAKELDPDNLAADAAVQIVTIKINEKEYQDGNRANEEIVLKGLNPSPGPYVEYGDVHYDAERLKRAQARDNGKYGFSSPRHDPIERSIERRLNEPISLIFKDTPLQQVILDLHSLSGINIHADVAALQDANISLEMPLSLSVEKINLKSALNLLLDQVKLTYVIKDQVLQITTKEKATGQRRMVTYSVADLVVPIENHPTSPVNDMNSALARHMASASGMMNTTASPFTPATSLPNGSTVSNQGTGVGTTFASNPNGVSPPNLGATRPPGQTMEDLLINLIENTVAHDSWSSVGGQGTIQYFPLGMALVVNQTQEVQEGVADLLASLRRLLDLEVAIEMRLVSVSESFFERIGVDFNVNFKGHASPGSQVNLLNGQFTPVGQVNGQFQGTNIVSGLTPAGTLTPDLSIPVNNSSFGFSIPPFGGYPGTLGADGGLSLGLAFLSDVQVFMLLEAAQGDRRMNIMQAPKLTVFNGQTANISVQDQQFFLTGVNINQANAQIFFTPNNQPFPLGVTMQVTPVVSADRRFVRLNLQPNLTNLANANVPLIPVQIPVPQLLEGPGNGFTVSGQPVIFQMFFQQPTFTTINLNTTVNVPDGGTVLLGGLKTMSEGRNEFGPPILSKIPYLSRLFKNVAFGRDGQSLMIMVTPRVIINEEEEQIFLGNLPPIPRP